MRLFKIRSDRLDFATDASTTMSLARAVSDMSIGPSGVAHGGSGNGKLITVEVRLKPSSMLRFDTIRQNLQIYIHEQFTRLEVGAELEGWQDVGLLERECERIFVTDCCECWTGKADCSSRRSIPTARGA